MTASYLSTVKEISWYSMAKRAIFLPGLKSKYVISPWWYKIPKQDFWNKKPWRWAIMFLGFTFICCGISLLMTKWHHFTQGVPWVKILFYSLWRFKINSHGCQVVIWNSCGNSANSVSQLEMASRKLNVSWPKMRHINEK